MQFEILFEGDLADAHKLPGLEGTQSLEGIGRSLTLISHFAATGEVRQRFPFSDAFSVNLLAFEAGSFRTIFGVTIDTTATLKWLAPVIGVGIVQGVAGNIAYDLMKYTFSSATGQAADKSPMVAELESKRSGDVSALQEAITPSLKRSHSVINSGAQQITINGNGNVVTIYNQESKEFLEEDKFDLLPEVKIVSTGMLNVNTRNGRVFDYEHHKLISIFVARDCTVRAMPNLARSLQLYAKSKEKSQVYIKYLVKKNKSGFPKSYLILDAWFEGEAPPSR